MAVSPDLEPELPETAETIRHQVRIEFRIYLVVVAIVSLAVGGIVGRYLLKGEKAEELRETIQPPLLPVQDDSSVPTISDVDKVLSVYVSGAVSTSKVVTVPDGSLVVDAIRAVGGATFDADLDAINLAAPLHNHEHILVPRKVAPGTTQAAGGLIDINTATSQELETLPNIGPTRAQQIVTYRETHGAFQSIQDIMEVSGIGPAIYEQLAPFIYVGE